MKLIWSVCMGLALAAVASAEEAQPYAGEVTASRLQLRAGPGEAYQAVVTLEEGARLIVLGKHGNRPDWLCVELPQGYHGWVYGRFLARKQDGTAVVTADRVLVRPRATTKYHHLNGRLDKGEQVTVLEEQQTSEGTWVKIVVPRRFPLYAHGEYIKDIGDAALAEPTEPAAPAEPDSAAAPAAAEADGSDGAFEALVKEITPRLTAAKTTAEIEPLRRAVEEVDSRALNRDNRIRRYQLLRDMGRIEHQIALREIDAKSREIDADLEARLAEIERTYEERLRGIREEFGRKRKPRFVSTGIVRYRPDIVGRHPSFRLEEGRRMRYFLIALDFDLHKFDGKRVGVTGLLDPESGTGYETIMVTRIEILGER